MALPILLLIDFGAIFPSPACLHDGVHAPGETGTRNAIFCLGAICLGTIQTGKGTKGMVFLSPQPSGL